MSNRINSAFAYVPLSEERVVAKLIQGRAVQDASFYPTTEPRHYLETDGVFSLNEDVLCVYADLDSLIERTDLSPMERETVMYLMKGYTLPDIAYHFGKTRQMYEVIFKRAVKKIVKRNDADWEEYTGGRIDDD